MCRLKLPSRWLPPLLLACCLLILAGCNGSSRPEPNQDKTEQVSAREALAKKRLCSDNFLKIYQVLRPSPANVDAELQSAQDLLNQWLLSCAEWSGREISPDAPEFQGHFDAEEISDLNQRAASQLDILFLRDQLLVRSLVEHVLQDVPTDAAKVRRVFEFVCRNVAHDEKLIHPLLLDPQTRDTLGPHSIPRSLQDICLTGRGTPEDRTWLLAAFLQQLNLKTLLIEAPASEPAVDARYRYLAVVPLDDSILIFSPGLGVEFRPAAEQWTPARLAGGWEEVFQGWPGNDPAALELLAPLLSQDWAKGRVLLPYSILQTSPRMAAMQLELVGDTVCEVSLPLSGEGGQPGLVDGLRAAVRDFLPDFRPVFWEYPQVTYSRLVAKEPQAERLRQLAMATLFKEVVSVRSSEDQKEQRVFTQNLEKRMLMARLDHLTGNHEEAISTYIKLRLQQGMAGDGPEIALENLLRYLQAENAHYWSALAQFENGDYRSAGDTLQNYLARYPEGNWVAPGRELWARALMNQGKREQAMQLLESDKAQGPERFWQLKLKSEPQH
ncbi:MAG: tetratricopeptide repeat protein [Planctomycetaceae bacterium]|nr:tetratricopeptide repeat protein [Planctomycetaceae bacterium]